MGGQDATTSMERFHKDDALLERWLKPLYIGELKPEDTKKTEIERDFDELTEDLKREGYFKANLWFYAGMLGHIIAMEIAAWYYVHIGGVEWGGSLGYWCLCCCLLRSSTIRVAPARFRTLQCV